MANIENLIPEAHKLTLEDQSNGGKRSGEVRKEKARLKKELEMILDSTNDKGVTYNKLVSLGLIANAIDKKKGGNPEAFKIIAKMLGEYETEEVETETPTVQIIIKDNDELEKAMYEDND